MSEIGSAGAAAQISRTSGRRSGSSRISGGAAGAQALDSIAQHRGSAGSVARVTAESLQVGAEAHGLGAGALGLAGERGDVAGVLGGGTGQCGGIGLRRAAGRRGIQAGGVALRSEVPGGRSGEQDCCRNPNRQRMPAEQRQMMEGMKFSIQNEIARVCASGNWPKEAVQCLGSARSEADAEGCIGKYNLQP